MKFKAQSLIEFSVILLVVTAIAVISLQIMQHVINSRPSASEKQMENSDANMKAEEQNCLNYGLHWDAKNGVCEAQ